MASKFKQLYDNGLLDELVSQSSIENSPESYYWRILALARLDKIDEAISNLEKGEFDNLLWRGRAYNKISGFLISKMKLEFALNFANTALKIFEEIDDIEGIISSMSRIALIQYYNGYLDLSFDYYEKALLLSESGNYLKLTSKIINNLGEIYRARGELDHALLHYQKACSIAKDSGNLGFLAIFFSNSANIFITKGQYDKAKEYFEESIRFFEKISDPETSSFVLISFIEAYLIFNDENEVTKYLDMIEKIKTETNNPFVKINWLYAKAVTLKSSIRIKDKVKSQELFESIITSPQAEFEILAKSMYHLIELLVYEYKMYEEEVVLEEITNYANELYILAKNHRRYATLIDVLLIQSRLAVIQNNFDYANILLTQALIMAEEKQMVYYTSVVENELQTLEKNIASIRKLLENSSIASKLEQIELLNYLRRARQVGDNFGK